MQTSIRWAWVVWKKPTLSPLPPSMLKGADPIITWGCLQLGIIERLRLPRAKLRSYLEAVESTYRSEAECPYHNKIHAADVVQVGSDP